MRHCEYGFATIILSYFDIPMSNAGKAIFLSYASQDADAARRICDVLRAAGLEVWFDQSELRGGDAWDASIRKQIKECALFVPIVSANTNAREEGYFRLEWKLAVDRSHLMADNKAFFVPVILGDVPEPTALVPDKFRERQWSRLNNDGAINAFAERVKQLLAITVVPAGPTIPARAPATENKLNEPPILPAPASAISDRSAAAPRPRRRTLALASVGAALIAAALFAGWTLIEQNRKDAFVTAALPKIEIMAREGKYVPAFKLAREVELQGGGQSLTPEVWERFARTISITSQPDNARVAFRPFGNDDDWITMGATPLEKVRIPRGPLVWKAQRTGHISAEQVFTAAPAATLSLALMAESAADKDMILVSGADVRLWVMVGVQLTNIVPIAPFLIDRTETTNKEFAKFVQAGGYANEAFWKHPFKDGKRQLSFAQAMERFRDTTGRPGPATWRVGNFPDGEAEMPVRGISWYEAAAFAAFAGKELPTIFHWYRADTAGDLELLPGLFLPLSNYESKGPRPAGASQSRSAFGAIDMAGNVREWAANAVGDDARVALGGAWTDPAYQYLFPDIRSAFDRAAENGMRTIKRVGDAPLPEAATAPLQRIPPPRPHRPITEPEYQTITRFFERQRMPLEPRIDATDESSPHWVKQKVSFAAGYGGERLTAYLYLPRSAKPPYQVVIQMGGSGTFYRRTSVTEQDIFGWGFAEPLIRGGRAVLLPLWKGSYERSDGFAPFDADIPSYRDHVVKWVHEVRQSIDYLQSRKDIDGAHIGYQGISFGTIWAPQFMALEPRLKTGILLLGGIPLTSRAAGAFPPELDILNYAPRVKEPVLMLNGRNDAIFPYESSQVPLFDLLGTPKDRKRHNTFPGGHSSFGWNDELIRESLDWLDHHFGAPVANGETTAPKK